MRKKQLQRTLIVLGEISPHDLINSRPFWGRGMTGHSAPGMLGGEDGGGGLTPGGGEEGGASEDGKGHGWQQRKIIGATHRCDTMAKPDAHVFAHFLAILLLHGRYGNNERNNKL